LTAQRLFAKPMDKTRGQTKVVVVVDDPGDVRRLVSEMLRRDGCLVVEAGSTEQALSVIDDEVALVVTDVDMAALSGVELIELSKRRRPALPVIAMSGDALRLNEASHAGADTLLLKPFSTEQLVLAVELCLTSWRLST
jgi:DNA-binding NtrC family response regulator